MIVEMNINFKHIFIYSLICSKSKSICLLVHKVLVDQTILILIYASNFHDCFDFFTLGSFKSLIKMLQDFFFRFMTGCVTNFSKLTCLFSLLPFLEFMLIH